MNPSLYLVWLPTRAKEGSGSESIIWQPWRFPTNTGLVLTEIRDPVHRKTKSKLGVFNGKRTTGGRGEVGKYLRRDRRGEQVGGDAQDGAHALRRPPSPLLVSCPCFGLWTRKMGGEELRVADDGPPLPARSGGRQTVTVVERRTQQPRPRSRRGRASSTEPRATSYRRTPVPASKASRAA
jgi:hypothetical protein